MHAAIIGAGPGGSSAAIVLAARGWRVTVIERAQFPRVKVCGEFISPAATAWLESLVPGGALRDVGARAVSELVLELGERARVWSLPGPAWVLSRRALDHLLLSQARVLGVEVMQPATVRRVEYTEDGVVVNLADSGVGAATVNADLVIHADGRGRHDAPPARPVAGRAGVVGCKCHLAVPGGVRGLRMRSAPGAYIGLVEVEHGEATCALVARSDLLRAHRADTDAMLTALWPAYRAAWRTSPWLSCPVQSAGFTRSGHPRSFRVGNAAAAVEPVGGEGIGLALWSGVTLAGMLSRAGTYGLDELARIHADYGALYRARLRTRRAACRAAAELLMRPRWLRAVWPLLGAGRFTIAPWYRLTGKATC